MWETFVCRGFNLVCESEKISAPGFSSLPHLPNKRRKTNWIIDMAHRDEKTKQAKKRKRKKKIPEQNFKQLFSARPEIILFLFPYPNTCSGTGHVSTSNSKRRKEEGREPRNNVIKWRPEKVGTSDSFPLFFIEGMALINSKKKIHPSPGFILRRIYGKLLTKVE